MVRCPLPRLETRGDQAEACTESLGIRHSESPQIPIANVIDQWGTGGVRMKVIPGHLGTRAIHVEVKFNIGSGLNVGPLCGSRLVVIEQDDLGRMLGHVTQHVRRKTEVEDEDLPVRQAI